MSARRTTGASLCEDLLTEIFSRLPARSAARCAALSRRWRKLINDPDFWLHRHRPPWPDLNIAYIHEYAGEPGKRALQGAFHLVGGLAHGFLSSTCHGLTYRYVGTCNGLVALQVQGLYAPRFFACVVLNPATTEEASLVYLGLGEERHLCGFCYSPASRRYKLLVVRRDRGCFHGGPLQVLSLGDVRGEARTVFPEADGSTAFSLCIGGKVYLLDDKKLRVLAFDVDSETISTVQLPGRGIACSEPMEVGGRLCIAMQNDRCNEMELWLLTSSLEWERRYVLRHVEPRGWSSHCWVVGVWDCGEDRLLAWYRGRGLRLYDLRLRGVASYAGAREPAGRWTLEDQTDSGDHLRWGYGQYRLCWGYRPTAISPRVIVGNCTAIVPHVLCSFQSGRRTPERTTMPFFDVLSGLVRALLVGEEVPSG